MEPETAAVATPVASAAPSHAPSFTEVANAARAQDTGAAQVAGDNGETSGPRFTVKVDGQDLEVTQEELVSGYQRQADYTRKTQALAQERERLSSVDALAAAFNTDPRGTIGALAQAYGLTISEATQLAEQALDPVERRVIELEQRAQQSDFQARQSQIERELGQIKATYGDFDERALLEHAISNNIGNLQTAFRDMTWEAQRQAAEGARVEAKRDASALVGAGHGGAAVGTTAAAISDKPSFREAFNAAVSTHRN